MNRVTIFQFLWVALGVLYNLVSLWFIKSGGAALAPTDAIAGLAFMTIAAVIIFAGFMGYRRIYAIAILPIIALLAYSGIYAHVSALISNAALPGYSSALSWGLAIGINLMGLGALIKGYRA